MEEIRKFLSEPEEHQDEFWESDALIWVFISCMTCFYYIL